MKDRTCKRETLLLQIFGEVGKTQAEKWGEEETKIEKWVSKTK